MLVDLVSTAPGRPELDGASQWQATRTSMYPGDDDDAPGEKRPDWQEEQVKQSLKTHNSQTHAAWLLIHWLTNSANAQTFSQQRMGIATNESCQTMHACTAFFHQDKVTLTRHLFQRQSLNLWLVVHCGASMRTLNNPMTQQAPSVLSQLCCKLHEMLSAEDAKAASCQLMAEEGGHVEPAAG